MIFQLLQYISARSNAIVPYLPQILLLLMLMGATYCEFLSHTFLVSWDAPGYITQNPAVTGLSLHNFLWHFLPKSPKIMLPCLAAACAVGAIALLTQSVEQQGGRVDYSEHDCLSPCYRCCFLVCVYSSGLTHRF